MLYIGPVNHTLVSCCLLLKMLQLLLSTAENVDLNILQVLQMLLSAAENVDLNILQVLQMLLSSAENVDLNILQVLQMLLSAAAGIQLNLAALPIPDECSHLSPILLSSAEYVENVDWKILMLHSLLPSSSPLLPFPSPLNAAI